MEEDELGAKLQQEYERIKKNVKKPNVLIAGTTGAGKSSVINMIFGNDVAIVGTGKPVTQKIDVYESENSDVRIFDSKGYEIGEEADKEFYESVIGLAKQTNNPENSIHLIWYCIPCNGARVTDYDLEAINTFHEANIPTAIVLTKADLPSESEIQSLREVLPNWAKDSIFELSIKNPEYNHIEELISWSISTLPDALKDAFIKSQKANLEEKWRKAHSMIAQHTVGAFAVGFTPIPMSDAPLLVANELTLLARILYLYDLGSLSDMLKTAGLSAALGPLLTSGGKAAVGAVLKMIPGVGTLVGGMISGAVGAAVTGAFGEATSAVACTICKAKLSGDTSKVDSLMGNFGNEIITLAKTWISQGKNNSEDYKYEDLK